MKYTQKKFETHDFLRIRDFLKHSLKSSPNLKNWSIDRWNFCRYWGQIMHNTFEMWPETVGIWEDEHKEIVAVVAWKAVIYEAIKRVKDKGAERIFVGSGQPFYLSMGFSLAYSKEVWQKKNNLV